MDGFWAELGRCRVRMDPETNPKEIDLTPDAGRFAGSEVRGVYAALPDGKTRICLRLPTSPKVLPRPKGFLTGSGGGLYTITLERR